MITTRSKDPILVSSNSNVDYKYTCNTCQSQYIRMTERRLEDRIKEHVPKWLNNPTDNDSRSSVTDHVLNNGHVCDRDNCFSIVYKARHPSLLKFIEAVAIRRQKPDLNKCRRRWTFQQSSVNLPAVLNDPSYHQLDFFSRSWFDYSSTTEIPPSPHLPEVDRRDFADYLDKLDAGGTPKANRTRVSTSSSIAKHPSNSVKQKPTNGTCCRQSSPSSPPPTSTSASYSLTDIPPSMFKSDFSLSHPPTFHELVPIASRSLDSPLRLSSQLEKLMALLDIVEIQLGQQVGKNSNAFIDAVCSHDVVCAQLRNVTQQVHSLRLIILSDFRQQLLPCLTGMLHAKRLSTDLFVISSTFHVELLRLAKLITSATNNEKDQPPSSSLRSKDCHDGDDEFDAMSLPPFEQPSLSAWLDTVQYRCSKLTSLFRRALSALNLIATNTLVDDGPDQLADQQLMLSVSASTNQLIDQLKSDFLSLLQSSQFWLCQSLLDSARLQLSSGPAALTNDGRVASSVNLQSTPFHVRLKRLNRLATLVDECQVELNQSRQQCLAISRSSSRSSSQTKDANPSPSSEPLINLIGVLTSELIIDPWNKSSLALLESSLEGERWEPSIETDNGSVEEVASKLIETYLGQLEDNDIATNRPTSTINKSSLPKSGDNQASYTSLLLAGERFVVVDAITSTFLPLLTGYLQLAESVPLATLPWCLTELSHRLADLFELFNSRTCELVLGAKLLERPGTDLTSILPQHLASALRSIQFVERSRQLTLAYFNHQHQKHSHASRHIPTHYRIYASGSGGAVGVDRQALASSLARLQSAFSDHIDRLIGKLLQLLSSRIKSCLAGWYIRPPTPSRDFQSICQGLTTVADVTGAIVPPDLLTSIFIEAHGVFKSKLRQRLIDLKVVADGGPKHSLLDGELTYYLNELRTLTSRLAKFTEDFSDIWPSSVTNQAPPPPSLNGTGNVA